MIQDIEQGNGGVNFSSLIKSKLMKVQIFVAEYVKDAPCEKYP